MARSHNMTPARRAALKKAQLSSARKRRGRGKGKLAAANRHADAKAAAHRKRNSGIKGHLRRNAGNYFNAAYAAAAVASVAYGYHQETGLTKGKRSELMRSRARKRLQYKMNTNIKRQRGGDNSSWTRASASVERARLRSTSRHSDRRTRDIHLRNVRRRGF